MIATLGMLVGFTANIGLLRQVVEGGATRAELPASEQLPVPVMLDEVQELLADGALPVDARLPEQYAEGYLPNARNLPLSELEMFLDAFKGGVETNRVLIVYCNGYGCPDSFDLAQVLIREGYRDVRVFEGGFPEWQDAGLPVAGVTQ